MEDTRGLPILELASPTSDDRSTAIDYPAQALLSFGQEVFGLRWALLVLVAAVAVVRFVVAGAMSGPLDVARPATVAHYGVQLPRAPLPDGTERGAGVAISPDSDSEDAGTVTDLQGDEVSSAVAKYRLDQDGNLYELHAPHTEVAKLPSPVG